MSSLHQSLCLADGEGFQVQVFALYTGILQRVSLDLELSLVGRTVELPPPAS